jgi:hypothetical protein
MLGLTPCPDLLWAGGGGAVCAIFLVEGVVEAPAHHARDGWDESPRVPLSTMMASADVRSMSCPFLKASLGAPAAMPLLLPLPRLELCLIVLHAFLRFGLSSSCWCCHGRLLVGSGCFAAIVVL